MNTKKKKRAASYDVGNQGPGMEQVQTYDGLNL